MITSNTKSTLSQVVHSFGSELNIVFEDSVQLCMHIRMGAADGLQNVINTVVGYAPPL